MTDHRDIVERLRLTPDEIDRLKRECASWRETLRAERDSYLHVTRLKEKYRDRALTAETSRDAAVAAAYEDAARIAFDALRRVVITDDGNTVLADNVAAAIRARAAEGSDRITVPSEPTYEMVEAGIASLGEDDDRQSAQIVCDVFRAMITAAQDGGRDEGQ